VRLRLVPHLAHDAVDVEERQQPCIELDVDVVHVGGRAQVRVAADRGRRRAVAPEAQVRHLDVANELVVDEAHAEGIGQLVAALARLLAEEGQHSRLLLGERRLREGPQQGEAGGSLH
jgi:hypothetical protein